MTRIGSTSYGFRYLLEDPLRAPPIIQIVETARALGLECLQLCENARPLELSAQQWRDLLCRAAEIGIGIQLGCMTLEVDVLARYIERAVLAGSNTLRIVLEEAGRESPRRAGIAAFLEAAAPRLQAAGVTLAIENHFHIPSRILAELARPYPEALIGFCIDSANSLRNFEPPEEVMACLASRALFYHLKDFKVKGTNVGFSVGGAPLGMGDLDLDRVLDLIYARDPGPLLFLENWVEPTGDRDTDVRQDRDWLLESLRNLRARISRRLHG